MGGGLGRVTNHPEYYLSDGSVSFLTENTTLFRVHKSFFERESPVFRDLFASAAEDDPQSGTDARPFTLDVTSDEFAHLLWVWYDREYSYQQQTKKNWVVILQLSTRWEFHKVKELALRELEALEIPPAEKISIYNKHGIDGERLLSSYIELCKSPTVPTEADGHLIEMDKLIKVLQAREHAQRKAVEQGHKSPTSGSLEDEALREIVSKHFNQGLNPRPHGTPTGSGGQAPDLNGEPHGTTAGTSTITLGKPQVPDRNAQSTSGLASHSTGSEGKGSQEKEQGKGKEAESKNAREKAKEDEGKPEKARLAREKEEEKARQAKEKEAKEKEEKARQAKEKEEEKAGLAKEKGRKGSLLH